MIDKLLKDYIRKFRVFIIRRLSCLGKQLSLHGKIVIVAPHPDDEVLGAGGLIQRLISEDNHPYVIILTKGEKSHEGCCNLEKEEIKIARHQLTLKALETLGLKKDHLYTLNFQDGGIANATIQQKQELFSVLKEIGPNVLFVPHKGEGWCDHVSILSLTQRTMGTSVSIYEYCVWFWYYNVWKFDLGNLHTLHLTNEEFQLKCESISQYVHPLAPCGKPWSGVLPKVFVQATQWKNEIFFKVQ